MGTSLSLEARHAAPRSGSWARPAGPEQNERLTAWAGAALFVLLAAEGVTILSIHRFKLYHVVIGLVLIGPMALKLASTGYRFLRYYSGDPAYRHAGPPRPFLRILAPFLVVATGAVVLSGVALMFTSDSLRHPLEFVHKASFIAWIALAGLHVLAYVWRVPGLVLGDLARFARGTSYRVAALVVSAAAGIGLVFLLAPWVRSLVYG
jgi:cytochrome b subunit of formate dehydrogenase